jgi:anti-sigma factor RsiW
MTCSETRTMIGAYVDGEIDPATAADVERHLRECAACSREEAAIRSLGETLRRPEHSFRAPAGLMDSVRFAARRGSGFPRPSRRQSFLWLGLAASFAFGVLVTWVLEFRTPRSELRQQVAQELLSAHIRSLLPNHLIDVESTDQHTVKPWFAGKLDYSPPVADLANQGFPLVGGRLDALEGHPIAVLVYRRRQHLINVFVRPTGRGAGEAPKSSALNGYNLVGGAAAGMEFWVVSDLNAEELARFADAFRSIATSGPGR